MDTDTLNASINLVEDFQSLHATIAEDHGGDQTRSLIEYFRTPEARSLAQSSNAPLLHEAIDAYSRIVLAAWQEAHGADLRV